MGAFLCLPAVALAQSSPAPTQGAAPSAAESSPLAGHPVLGKTAEERALQFQTMIALQNMQSYEQLAEAHAQHLQKLVPAFENLYNAMPDQQKRLADQVFRANAEQHTAQSHRGRNG